MYKRQLHDDGRVSIANVPAYRLARQVPVLVGSQRLHGDIAWGGNWFFLCDDHGQNLTPDRTVALTAFAEALRQALVAQGITGADGAEIDHIELIGPPADPANDGRNFVLCPGSAYDRSPCGTGTSAKLACLAAEGHLAPGALWRQESVIGSVFEGRYQPDPDAPTRILPTITGRAYVNLDAQLVLQPGDPFAWGIPR